MREIGISDKEELYDVIAALSAVIRELTEEIVELQGLLCDLAGHVACNSEVHGG